MGISLAAGIGGDDIPIEAVFEQIGTSLVITTTNRTNQERCTYSGTITGDSLTASLSSCTPRVLALGPACAFAGDGPARSREWTKETLSVEFSGRVDGDVLTGTVSEIARVVSGEESHDVTIAADLMLTR